MKEPKVLVYQNIQQFATNPKGGPAGVGNMYYNEKLRRGDNTFEYLDYPITKRKGTSIMKHFPKLIREVVLFFINRHDLICKLNSKPVKTNIDFDKYDIIYFHSTISLFNEQENLKDYKGIVVLQSHSPQPLSHEFLETYSSFLRFTVRNSQKRYERMDEYAFERADYIVFPCQDAMEPYFHEWPYFQELYQRKKDRFRYILTGIIPPQPNRSREEVLKELGLSDNNFLVNYVGRHNEVKGYDSLKRIGKEVLNANDNIKIIVAGKEGPLTRLNHPNWIEIGWTTDAYSYIAASDVFILPNKETYFDIVMLEVLSLGKIVIASRTGGNKYFEKQGVEGVFLYDTEEEAIKLINRVFRLSEDEKRFLGLKNKEFFLKNCQVSNMYDSFISIMKQIWDENK